MHHRCRNLLNMLLVLAKICKNILINIILSLRVAGEAIKFKVT